MKFLEKIKNNWKEILISAGILGCGILLGGYVMCDRRKNLEKTENNNNYNNNYNCNNKHNKHNNYKNKKNEECLEFSYGCSNWNGPYHSPQSQRSSW